MKTTKKAALPQHTDEAQKTRRQPEWKLIGKTIAMADGTSGSGYCLATSLAQMQARIVLLAPDKTKLDKIFSRLRGRFPETEFFAITADFSSPVHMADALNIAGANFKGIDVLINNLAFSTANVTQADAFCRAALDNAGFNRQALIINLRRPATPLSSGRDPRLGEAGLKEEAALFGIGIINLTVSDDGLQKELKEMVLNLGRTTR